MYIIFTRQYWQKVIKNWFNWWLYITKDKSLRTSTQTERRIYHKWERESPGNVILGGLVFVAVVWWLMAVVAPAASFKPITISCKNTKQGISHIADDRGAVCRRQDVLHTGCCPETTDIYSCNTCNKTSKCCHNYEYCVSCCLGPAYRSIKKEVLLYSPDIRLKNPANNSR